MRSVWTSALCLALAACGQSRTFTPAEPSAAQSTVSNNTPGFIKNAKDLGPVDPNTVIDVTAWLKLRNENQLQQLIIKQQTRGNANFHSWLTQDQFNAQFSPTAQELKSVSNWLSAHNLTVIDVAENNFYVKVEGTVGAVEKAFHVQIDNYSLDGVTYRSNSGNPQVDNSVGNIAAITGMDDFGFHPNNVRPVGPDGAAAAPVKLSSLGSNGLFFSAGCIRPAQTVSFTGGGHTATYSGNRYGQDISNQQLGSLPPCGYQPSEIRKAYGLDGFGAGFDGAGQTVVITDGFGSPTIQQDAAVFASLYGLPPVDLTIVKGQGLTNNGSPRFGAAGWASEVTLDVEWVHAIAPAAKIVLVVAPSNNALDEAINLAVVRGFGNTISNSWSNIEGFGNPAQLGRVERILMQAAAKGIDVNFSSGDDGDESHVVGFRSVDYPGSSNFATSIGGTSLVLDSSGGVAWETGWGNNLTRIADKVSLGSPPIVPPDHSLADGLGFQFGAGGGTSLTFAAPSWQAGLGGTMRQVPDISFVADPFTGVEIIQTDTSTGDLTVGVIGGTSLSCPVFSGLMAIAAQRAGHGLGQAAPLLYGLSSGIRDIGAVTSSTNVTGVIDATSFGPADLVVPENTAPFYSALYNSPFSTRWFVISFGTDTSLNTGPGWDNVTGLGVPDGINFVNAISQ